MRKLFYFGLLTLLVISCRKDDSNPPAPMQTANYLPLTVGNYWIYQHYKIDSLGNETALSYTDSIVVARDTMINNNQYFVLEGTNYPYSQNEWGIIDIVRDSSGFIVDNIGNISFSSDNFEDILASKTEVINNDTIYTLTFRMEEPDITVSVPAGEFEVLNFKGTLITFPKIKQISNPRYENNYYSKNVGKILGNYHYISQPSVYEKRLIRYNINKDQL
ncbi:hypothetical protein INQ51_10650 [Maribellus sp. CM-23]|uniref:hypothetical protein n=1 Tax=Maribellus sp. CM-23 TaxID=2781026 RepID=UPI001F297287|nr:hypothetical protein [Maribellus sp. CM-23]MCE4564769.1 hypothetical protein [Maribellus sp. CM-23]